MAAPKFNRLALAAALLEYDNDPNDPYRENIDHRESAIFRGLRMNRPPPSIPPLEHQEEPLPRQRPVHNRRQSRLSALLPDEHEEELVPEEEADIGGWNRNMATHPGPRAQSMDVGALVDDSRRRMPNTHAVPSGMIYPQQVAGRAHSVHLERFSSEGSIGKRESFDQADVVLRDSERVRRNYDEVSNGGTPHRRRKSTIKALALEDDDGNHVMVPMPDSPTSLMSPRMGDDRPPPRQGPEESRFGDDLADLTRPLSLGDDLLSHRLSLSDSINRPLSLYSLPASTYSGAPGPPPLASPVIRLDPEENERELLRNPFELPAPPPELGSRFDPKAFEVQRRSLDGLGVDGPGSRRQSFFDNPDAPYGRGPSYEGLERGEEEEEDSGPPLKIYDDIPTAAEYGRPLRQPRYQAHALRIARQELLHPKTLIMPSLLEGTERQHISVHVPDGFMLGEKPLPADARSSILNMGKGVPLSLSQRTFRSSLMVGGRREDEFLGHAAEEGEFFPGTHLEDEEEEEDERHRPGKLYGTSLIDQLENRKAVLRNKKRTFYGDNRPSMMSRPTTLIDPATIEAPPALPPPNGASGSDFGGRPLTYAGGQVPTINLPDDDDGAHQRMIKSRSVFGVDTVWEGEMAKLKKIQEAQAVANADEQAKKDAKDRARAGKRKSRWGRKSTMILDPEAHGDDGRLSAAGSGMLGDPRLSTGSLGAESRNSMAADPRRSYAGSDRKISMDNPLVLSLPSTEADEVLRSPVDSVGRASERGSRLATDRASRTSGRHPTVYDPDHLAHDGDAELRPGTSLGGANNWFQSSDDDTDGDGRSRRRHGPQGSMGSVGSLGVEVSTSGVPSSTGGRPTIRAVQPPPPQLPTDESSDEDVPLSKLQPRARSRYVDEESSDEDVPLSRLQPRNKQVVQEESSDEELPLSQLKAKDEDVVEMAPKKKHSMPTIKAVEPTAPLDFDLPLDLPLDFPSPTSPTTLGGPTAGPAAATAPAAAAGDDDDDDVPLYVRKARQKAMATGGSGTQTVEEIEDDLPLGWKHAGAAQKRTGAQHLAAMGYADPRTTMMSMPAMPYGYPGSAYGVQSAYGMPTMPMSMYGAPPMMGMGPGSMGGMSMGAMSMGGMGMMGPPSMGTMPPMTPMSGMGPVAPGMPFPPFEAANNPGRNIDDWRKQVLAPDATGSGQTTATSSESR